MIFWVTVFITFVGFLLSSFLYPNNSKSNITISVLKGLSALSLANCLYWVVLDCPTVVLSFKWVNSLFQEISASLSLDYYSIVFGAVALFVTWSIIEFSHYYMEGDPFKQAFFNTLILFLFFMLLLVTANNLFILFIGWEGVGILSFILIGWWFSRSDANSAALQAIIYNRIGDGGMILFIILALLSFNTWDLNEIIFFNTWNGITKWALLGIVVAAAGKSAQFSLHPWLPSAMEGPTPVSALLHSSTMVVAGVFLLVRCSPLFSGNPWITNMIALLGALTALFAASAALCQYDIKKIVAYSTTSQLGLMVVAVGIGLPWLALFHICTHAFFKALLFLCSGSIIHSLGNEQDLRKMGGGGSILPITTSALTMGSLALCGVPFLAGFYSKDLILEASQYNISNSLSIILSLIATLMTALYSARIIFFLTQVNSTSSPLSPISEENYQLTFPLLRLLGGVFIAGWSFSLSSFHSLPLVIPLSNKSLPLFFTIGAIIFLIYFSKTSSSKLTNSLQSFLGSNWFYVHLFHGPLLSFSSQGSIGGVLRSLDQGWTSQLGPWGTPPLFTQLSKVFQSGQTGNLINYIFYFITLTLLLLFFSTL
uniref:NADH-ubiquinone oxidoreductase chain 5 n=1 Tax=Amphioplus laevis TaxID=2806440 RepID=A0A888VGH5_9ECHI|nr:NADH dehydrogenase subunit 5 [Amphioplus laevis]QRC36799.1 NADH dehydrogenase subunit 5 [Amphioplus laevis]